jgi:hypothetical protein
MIRIIYIRDIAYILNLYYKLYILSMCALNSLKTARNESCCLQSYCQGSGHYLWRGVAPKRKGWVNKILSE